MEVKKCISNEGAIRKIVMGSIANTGIMVSFMKTRRICTCGYSDPNLKIENWRRTK